MGCVIVEGDSLALFTALKISPGTLYTVNVKAYKAYKITSLDQKISTIVCVFYEKRQLKMHYNL